MEAAIKQVKLLGYEVLVANMFLFTMEEEHLLEVGNHIHQCVLWSKWMTLVGNRFTGHLASRSGRQVDLDGQGLYQRGLDWVLGLASLLVKLYSFGIPAKGGIFHYDEQFSHFSAELNESL